MAKIVVNDYIDIGTGGFHNATSWQIAKDSEFTKIIDESLIDTVNVKSWHSMLPKLEEDKVPGESNYYADLDILYARVKIHVDEHESPWFVCEPKNQNIQDVVITEKDKEDIYTTSIEINMK